MPDKHFLLALLCCAQAVLCAQQPAVIPQPARIDLSPELAPFVWRQARFIAVDPQQPDIQALAVELSEILQPYTGYPLPVVSPAPDNQPGIILQQNPLIAGEEAYRITSRVGLLLVEAATPTGIFWAIQTLRQMLPVVPTIEETLPVMSIEDAPAYPWRGGHLDVGRHFMPVTQVKRYIDMLSFYKFNVFHWHLTEDQGWRIDIEKYPKLTEVGAWRREADGSRYGGFYTQAEIREVIEYARKRHIMVVPEIEMPGHCMAALAAYPHLSCTGQPLEVPSHWGVMQDVFCPGKEATFSFIEDVLTEVIALFPAPYMHIGGDEVPKNRWQACHDCRRRMKMEGLPDAHALQSYFIRRIEQFLRSKGRQLIGWDEILEGGVSPNALIEVWRGDEQARAAAANGNRYLKTSYFDGHPGAYTLEKVYHFELSTPGLSSGQQQLCLGAECCVWTEHIPDYKLEPMLLPRLAALAEAIWSDGNRNYSQFKEKLATHYKWYERKGWQYGPEDRALFQSAIRFDRASRQWIINAQAGLPGINVNYWRKSNRQNVGYFTDSLLIQTPGKYTIQAHRNGRPFAEPMQYHTMTHLALGKTAIFSQAPHSNYGPLDKSGGLSDGLIGSTAFNDGVWLGWWGNDVEAVVDLGTPTAISEVSVNFFQQSISWILLPREVEIQLSSDSKTWQTVHIQKIQVDPRDMSVRQYHVATQLAQPTQTRYVRLKALNYGILPEGHNGAGGKAWVFADEIVVN